MSNKEIKKFDKNNNLIYRKNSYGFEYWQEYDEKSNLIHFKDSYGFEFWKEYERNNLIYFKNSSGVEYWYKYNKDNSRIKITQQEFKQIERRKEKQELYLNIKRSNRFEIIDI